MDNEHTGLEREFSPENYPELKEIPDVEKTDDGNKSLESEDINSTPQDYSDIMLLADSHDEEIEIEW